MAGRMTMVPCWKSLPRAPSPRLHSFDLTDGVYPEHALIEASNGNFYGTTSSGGTDDIGTTFEITPAGKPTSLHSFVGADGVYPCDQNYISLTRSCELSPRCEATADERSGRSAGHVLWEPGSGKPPPSTRWRNGQPFP